MGAIRKRFGASVCELASANQVAPVQTQVTAPGDSLGLAHAVFVDKAESLGTKFGFQLFQDLLPAARQAAVGLRPVAAVKFKSVGPQGLS
jgi:hypothetical protein